MLLFNPSYSQLKIVLTILKKMKEKNIEPYFIRLRDAPFYLGMDKNRFNTEVRPMLQNIPIGKHGISFDRDDLKAWAAHYKLLHAKPAKRALCDKNNCPACATASPSYSSTKKITDSAFTKILTQAISKKNKT